MGWNREDDVVVKQFFVTVNLILCQRGEGLTPQASQEKSPADDVIRDAVFVQKGAVIRQAKQLALLVCDDRHLFLVRIDRFDMSAYDLLHGLQALDLPHIAGLQGFHD